MTKFDMLLALTVLACVALASYIMWGLATAVAPQLIRGGGL